MATAKKGKGKWTEEENALLIQLIDELKPESRKDYDKLVDHGLRPRTGQAAQKQAGVLGKRESGQK